MHRIGTFYFTQNAKAPRFRAEPVLKTYFLEAALLRACLGNGELASLEVRVVEGVNGLHRVSVVRHFDETEAL